eukprot:795513-Prymnesium_polylepis.1
MTGWARSPGRTSATVSRSWPAWLCLKQRRSGRAQRCCPGGSRSVQRRRSTGAWRFLCGVGACGVLAGGKRLSWAHRSTPPTRWSLVSTRRRAA